MWLECGAVHVGQISHERSVRLVFLAQARSSQLCWVVGQLSTHGEGRIAVAVVATVRQPTI